MEETEQNKIFHKKTAGKNRRFFMLYSISGIKEGTFHLAR